MPGSSKRLPEANRCCDGCCKPVALARVPLQPEMGRMEIPSVIMDIIAMGLARSARFGGGPEWGSRFGGGLLPPCTAGPPRAEG